MYFSFPMMLKTLPWRVLCACTVIQKTQHLKCTADKIITKWTHLCNNCHPGQEIEPGILKAPVLFLLLSYPFIPKGPEIVLLVCKLYKHGLYTAYALLCLTSFVLLCLWDSSLPVRVSSFAFCGLQDYFMMEITFCSSIFLWWTWQLFQVLPVTTNDGWIL